MRTNTLTQRQPADVSSVSAQRSQSVPRPNLPSRDVTRRVDATQPHRQGRPTVLRLRFLLLVPVPCESHERRIMSVPNSDEDVGHYRVQPASWGRNQSSSQVG